MDPGIAAIVSTLVAAMSVAAGQVSGQAVHDAYAGIKELLRRRFTKVNLQVAEGAPTAATTRATLGAQIEESGAAADPELLQQLKLLGAEIEKLASLPRQTFDIDVSQIRSVNAVLRDLEGKVRVKDVTAIGDFTLEHVRASGRIADPKAQ